MSEMRFHGMVPYLFYEEIEPALEWYARVFGFEERGRWQNDAGAVTNAEMTVGDTELWMDRGSFRWVDPDGKPASMWVGVWVDDVDAMYERVREAGAEPSAPLDRDFGVRTFDVKDPFGYRWGFMRRIGAASA